VLVGRAEIDRDERSREVHIARLPSVMRSRVGLLILALIVFGSGCTLDYGAYDQRGGSEIANRIDAAKLPFIEAAWYSAGDYMDPATVDIKLRAGATAEQARKFICDVAMPIVSSGDPPDGLSVVAWNTAYEIIASDSDPCPVRPSQSTR
jgi:hypothetical protein